MDLVRQSLAITFVLALLWLALWLLRRRGALRTTPRNMSKAALDLEHGNRLILGPQHSIHAVRIGQRKLVLAEFPHAGDEK